MVSGIFVTTGVKEHYMGEPSCVYVEQFEFYLKPVLEDAGLRVGDDIAQIIRWAFGVNTARSYESVAFAVRCNELSGRGLKEKVNEIFIAVGQSLEERKNLTGPYLDSELVYAYRQGDNQPVGLWVCHKTFNEANGASVAFPAYVAEMSAESAFRWMERLKKQFGDLEKGLKGVKDEYRQLSSELAETGRTLASIHRR